MPVEPITSFSGQYRFLSNFYLSPMLFGDREWASVEHCYQAMKATEYAEQERIRATATPWEAKQMGRKVKLHPAWDRHKVDIMARCLWAKFSNRELAEKLMETAPAELVEGPPARSRFWGKVDGEGENMLGKLLMQLRDELIAKEVA
jgi:ribA/ribD-fused uncharacterized protein